MKTNPTLVLVLFAGLFSFHLQAQQISALPDETGGACFTEKNDADHPCITDEQYALIEKRCADNVALLKLDQGKPEGVQQVSLNWPLRQGNGLNDCSFYVITAYVDQNTSTGAISDYNCGSNTYDGHKGTDIAIFPYPLYKMDHNQIEVIAAAPGTIVDKSDGNFDKNCATNNLTANYLVIQHADGSRILYFHMKKNSLTAKAIGQSVAVGEFLGVVGSSGNSSGPHLHFEVWAGSTVSTRVDPYSGTCNLLNASSWWAAQKPYTEPSIIKVSTNTTDAVIPGCPATETPNESSCFPLPFQGPGLSPGYAKFYIFIRNETAGMTANMSILNPDGTTFSSWVYNSLTTYNASYRSFSKLLPSTTGTYTFKATYNGATCSKTFDVVKAVVTPIGPTTICQGNSVELVTNALSTYLWSTGDTTRNITVFNAGNYTVTVTNANGCSAVSPPTTITVNPPPTAAITPNGATTFCQGGSVKLTAGAASAYQWSTGATTQSITVSSSGNYTVTVFDAVDCSAVSSPVAVTVNTLPIASITPSGPTTFCQGGSVSLSVAPASAYAWSNGATTQSITTSSSGTYTVTVTNANGCTASSSPSTVTVNPLPVASITPSGPTTFCQGGSVNLSAAPASAYLWSNGATTQSIAASLSGNYSVTVTGANGCTAGSSPTSVTVNPAPNASIMPNGSTTFCQGNSVNLSAAPGSAYVWSNGGTTQSITASLSGNYTVTVTSANGCTASSSPVTVTVNPLPVASITPSGPTTFCEGSSVNLSASPASAYAWSNGATSQSITASSSANYSVTVTSANGCTASSSPTSVTVKPLPVASITPGGPTTFCQGGSVSLTASAASAYLWNNGATIQSFTTSTPNNYIVTVTGANGCTAVSPPLTVTVNSVPVANISPSGPITFCEGSFINLSALSAPAYAWSNGATTQNITVSVSGNYVVTVSSPNGCSSVSSPTVVTVIPLPVATIIPGGPTTFCQGGSVILVAAPSSAYHWSTGAVTQSITVVSSGNYVVTVTNTNGCSASSSATAVTVHPLPAASITPGGPTSFCPGSSVSLTAGAASTYTWSNGAHTQSINASTSGNYTVIVTDANGCTASATPVVVTVHAPQNGLTILVHQDTLISPYTEPVYWYLIGNTTPVDSGLYHRCAQTGQYEAVGLDANGCLAMSTPVQVVCTPSGVKSVTTLENLQVYPNPTSDMLHIDATGAEKGQYHIKVQNVIGMVLKEDDMSIDHDNIKKTISLADLPNGVYFLSVEKGKASMVVKIVKMSL